MPWKFSDAPPCECKWLERAAAEPDVLVVFNEAVHEYHLVRAPDQNAGMILRYCPFCGGKAPESVRHSLFAHLANSEVRRLSELTRDVVTIEDALRVLGKPEFDHAHGSGVTTSGDFNAPQVAENFRTLVYSSLSETADVHVVESTPGRVRVQYVAKYVGPTDAA